MLVSLTLLPTTIKSCSRCARSEVEDKTQIIEKTAVVASITPSYADIHNLRLLNDEEEELFNSMEEFFESTIKTGRLKSFSR